MFVAMKDFDCRICGRYFKSSTARRMHMIRVHSDSNEVPNTMAITSRGHTSPSALIDDDQKMDITIGDQPTTSALVYDVDNKMNESSLSDSSSTRSSTASLTALANFECVLCAMRFVRYVSFRMHTLRSHSKKTADIGETLFSRVTSESNAQV